MAYHVSVVPATSAVSTYVPATSSISTSNVSIANNDTLLDLYINETVGGGTLIQILEMGPRLTLVWKD